MALEQDYLNVQVRQEGYMEIMMYVPDTSINISSVSSSDKLSYSNIDAIKNIKSYSSQTIATLEENLWLLNGLFPNILEGTTTPGYISNSMSDENGDFETNPRVVVNLSNTSHIENFSLMLNPAVPTGYPKTINIHAYNEDTLVQTFTQPIVWEEDSGEVDEEGQPIMVTKVLENLPSVLFKMNIDNINKLEIEFVGTRYGHRRIRVSTILFGKMIYLNQNEVLNADFLDKTSYACDTLPSRTFKFDVNNYNHIYDVDNPENGYISLDKQTIVQFRTGYNVYGYEKDENGNLVMYDLVEKYDTEEPVLDPETGEPTYDEDGNPITTFVTHENIIKPKAYPRVDNPDQLVEIEWDDWKELRLLSVYANSDESATFECGSVLDSMEEDFTHEYFQGKDRTVEEIVHQILIFEGLDDSVIEWSSDGIKRPTYDEHNNLLPYEQWTDTSYKDYVIGAILPNSPCREIIQLLAFSIGATILIKDNGKIKFANLDINKPETFTHQFEWTYKDFEQIPEAEQLESIETINDLSLPKYQSFEDQSKSNNGDHPSENGNIITTIDLSAYYNDVNYQECRPTGAGLVINDGESTNASVQDVSLFARNGLITISGLAEGETVHVAIYGYPVVTQVKQERNVTSSTLVLDTHLMKADVNSWNSDGTIKETELIKKKYLEWYKKKFKYKLTTRGEPLVDAGDYGTIQTQFTEEMPVYILQNHWVFDGSWAGDMEVISLGK